jgi:hypothetical protein
LLIALSAFSEMKEATDSHVAAWTSTTNMTSNVESHGLPLLDVKRNHSELVLPLDLGSMAILGSRLETPFAENVVDRDKVVWAALTGHLQMIELQLRQGLA